MVDRVHLRTARWQHVRSDGPTPKRSQPSALAGTVCRGDGSGVARSASGGRLWSWRLSLAAHLKRRALKHNARIIRRTRPCRASVPGFAPHNEALCSSARRSVCSPRTLEGAAAAAILNPRPPNARACRARRAAHRPAAPRGSRGARYRAPEASSPSQRRLRQNSHPGPRPKDGTLATGSSALKSANALAKSSLGTTMRVGPITSELLQRLRSGHRKVCGERPDRPERRYQHLRLR